MSNVRTTASGQRYVREKIQPETLTDVMKLAQKTSVMSKRGIEYVVQTQEDIEKYMDEAESLFSKRDEFNISIPSSEGIEEEQEENLRVASFRTRTETETETEIEIETETEIPSLSKIDTRALSILRLHPYFRYLLRGIPSWSFGSKVLKDDFLNYLRIYAGIEIDSNQFEHQRQEGDTWIFRFVRADEETQKTEIENNGFPLSASSAIYTAPPENYNLPLEEFINKDTSEENRNSILEDVCLVFLKVQLDELRVLDWWVEFI